MSRLPKPPGGEFVKTAHQRVVAFVLDALVLAFILCGWAGVVFVLQPFGHRQWSLVAVGAALAAVTLRIRRGRRLAVDQLAAKERMFGRSLRLGWRVVGAGLACWLGLILWSAISPGGAIPPAKSNPEAIGF